MIGGVEDDHPEPPVDQLTAKVWKSAIAEDHSEDGQLPHLLRVVRCQP